MIRLQDIADRVGVSRTTVSNVLHGNTKRVSQETREKIVAILKEEDYSPNMGSLLMSRKESRIIGVVLWYDNPHGLNMMQDPFISTALGGIQDEIKDQDYFLMLINGQSLKRVINIASRWSIDGLLTMGLNEDDYIHLSKQLNKPIVAIDAYVSRKCSIVNVGIDDYDGGYQMGRYFAQRGLTDALYITAYNVNADYYRWLGFKKAMEETGSPCSDSRNILVPQDVSMRYSYYKLILDKFLKHRAVFCASDALAIEVVNFFGDHGIRVPQQVSVAGFDDISSAMIIRPKLTTIHQDIEKKGALALRELLGLINKEPTEHRQTRLPVKLVIRDSVI